MPQFVFDTDHLTLFHHKHPVLMQHLAAQNPGAVAIAPITIEETLRGRLAVLRRGLVGLSHVRAYGNLVASVELFKLFPVMAFDQASEAEFQQLRAARLRVGTQDLKIAAIARTNQLTVLTRNRLDFGRVPGLALEDWSV